MIKRLLFALLFVSVTALLGYYFFLSRKKGPSALTQGYQLVADWPRLPQGFLLGNPTGMDMDSSGNLVVFHRAGRRWPASGIMPKEKIEDPTILVLYPDNGALVRSWGGGMFIMPHGLKIDQQSNIWVTDVGLHQVMKFNADGTLLMTLGEAGVPGKDDVHFDKPTDVAFGKDGSFFVSDGYGNSRVMHFTADGRLIRAWGTKGSGSGEFNIPHGMSTDSEGHLLVADRENNRIQVFDTSGKLLEMITDHSYGAVTCVRSTGSGIFFADDVSFWGLGHQGSDLIFLNSQKKPEFRFGRSGAYAGAKTWYHAMTIDKQGNIYVGDILGNTLQKFQPLIGKR
jgi:peptidylamidoglycolate lyase